MRGGRRVAVLAVLAVLGGLYAANASWLAPAPGTGPTLLAHRGIAQRFDTANLERDTCTAARMLPPRHGYLENTLASMRASFEAGADIVEIDVHPTTDGRFAVFHDWTLDCRTDGHGVTREHSMAQLKALDIGHGYTADGGRTFPFRGQGIGLMPALDEVLQALPRHRFLVNVKSNDPAEGDRLAAFLAGLPAASRQRVMVYGGDLPVGRIRQRLPDVQAMSRALLRSCLLRYAAYGWAGITPAACARMPVFVPINIAPWLWGWPNRLQQRLHNVGSEAYVLGPYHGGGFSVGLDTAEDWARLPEGYSGGIYTDEIVAVARWIKRGRQP
ncbi:glycerophosphodiester phosphodiesterase family protein [Bordetella sp. BOR01]|uniref:glycerophosphodiester phosphodiesterase family protein n=1 Tax=Bordetella sp. BOR01 TaxID=2854779 RepID=UPI001C4642EF|nr:glycerophosphodiester phosphodiesterase family protein [Bordetella sp. BOR01]MBV7483966.1 glycerophosphodiester phosphodiesterase [Bordetella sp. BOR01]